MVDKIINEEYMDLIIPNAILDSYSYAVNKTNINARYTLINVPKKTIDVCELGDIYSFVPAIYTTESTVALDEIGVTKVRYEPEYELNGTGALIGIIDSGINYLHPAFRYNDNTTKIQAIWDQTINEGATSGKDADFPYGTIYSKDKINYALKQSNPLAVVPTDDKLGHGTMVAGIAVGSEDEENEFSGVAPLAELLVVKLKQAKKIIKDIFSVPDDKICFQESDIMMGIRFVLEKAKKLQRPLVICIALGTNHGGEYGSGPLTNFLDLITTFPGVCSIISGGNEGNTGRHFFSKLTVQNSTKDILFHAGEKDKNFLIEIWPQFYQNISFELVSPSGETKTNINITIDYRNLDIYKFYMGETYICINDVLAEVTRGRQLILIRFVNIQSGLWTIRFHSLDKINSALNAFLPSGNILSEDTYFIDADSFTTITSPGNSTAPITITSYDSVTGNISAFSSKGYSRANEIKPDLVAPGEDITAPYQNNSYVSISGTGAAAAIVSGVIALIYEWSIIKGNFTNLSGTEIKTLLIQGAKRDPNVEYPNKTWGYGKVNLVGFFDKLTR
ncbi:S8 family peptidase [Lachnoclostridium phytofermentans]|uniref:Peptidase S8 and S53 subtilisin kexin sedolisin n=1 Tax=Lachnoclostridium phytofermentans (strain ATCC 700394 / DSM 18823 / ISDg) TaxID=357809 RepID=A9KQN6_LACP7|nr:S8 family peptidase [Lachnoclostridium phytofermentans]ABX41949.1 peptidase S8 and S53 subtilisin kexin sedolisin [Lachnoclostridium phytofermentans ISDg]